MPPRKWRQVEDQFPKHICHLNEKGYIETHSGLIRILLWEEPKPQAHRFADVAGFLIVILKAGI